MHTANTSCMRALILQQIGVKMLLNRSRARWRVCMRFRREQKYLLGAYRNPIARRKRILLLGNSRVYERVCITPCWSVTKHTMHDRTSVHIAERSPPFNSGTEFENNLTKRFSYPCVCGASHRTAIKRVPVKTSRARNGLNLTPFGAVRKGSVGAEKSKTWNIET